MRMGLPKGAQSRAAVVAERLAESYPYVACALNFENPFQLLVSTILSAQCTDVRVNLVTPALFEAYPTPESLAAAPTESVEALIHTTGFFRAKTRNLIGMAQRVVSEFAGEVPSDLDALVSLPGVGRKTANVVRSVAFDLPGLPVDTHVGRTSRRLRLTKESDPVKAERDLNRLFPPSEWGRISLRLIELGRGACDARKPRCWECALQDFCPSSGIGQATSAARASIRRSVPRARSAE